MANTFKFGNGNWASKKEAVLAYNDENSNFKPLPFTFDRASSATVVNKQGLIETVGTDEPRIDFLNNSKGHLLLEPSRQNVLQRNEEFENSYWNKSLISVTANDSVSPDGSVTADKIVSGNSTGAHFFRRTGLTYSATENTFSIFAKFTDDLFKQFHFIIYDGSNHFVYFDVKNGNVVSADSGVTASMINYGNGWYRCVATYQTASTSVGQIKVELGNSTNVTGDGSSGMLFWGIQWEVGSYATSYIPTQGSAVTRSAETCNSAGNDSIFSEAEGVLYVESEALANDETSRVIASISNGSSNTNRIVLQYTNNVGGNQVVVFAQTPSGYSSVLTRSITNALTFNKFAVVYNDSTNNFDLWVNGTKIGDGSLSHSFTANTLTTIQLADGNATGNPFYGRIKEVKVYNTALTDAELIALTS